VLVKGYRLSVLRWAMPGDLMYSIMTTVNKTILDNWYLLSECILSVLITQIKR
jgi:hypothetical protein